jgi:hypothetical protein
MGPELNQPTSRQGEVLASDVDVDVDAHVIYCLEVVGHITKIYARFNINLY